MKTSTKNSIKKSTLLILGLFFTLLFSTQVTHAQKVDVNGIVKGETETKPEVLFGVNIYLKDKSEATTSNVKGKFEFPNQLNIGDVIVFSYLGYLKKEVKITKNSTNLVVILKEDNNEMLGALTSNKRFSSKKKSQ